jgi:hypothetical protein
VTIAAASARLAQIGLPDFGVPTTRRAMTVA